MVHHLSAWCNTYHRCQPFTAQTLQLRGWYMFPLCISGQVGKQTDDPFPALHPEQTPGFVSAEFDLEAVAEARHRCGCHLRITCLVFVMLMRSRDLWQ